MDRASHSRPFQWVIDGGALVFFWLAVVFAVGAFIGGMVALVRLNFVGVLAGWVMGGFWCLMAYVNRQHLNGRKTTP